MKILSYGIGCLGSSPVDTAFFYYSISYPNQKLFSQKSLIVNLPVLLYTQFPLQLGDSGGLLLQRQNSNWKQFLFVDVQASAEEIAKHPEIIHIPKGSYLCKKVEHSDIHQAWDWSLPFVKKEQIQLVIEIELFVGNYHFSAPALEQRCLLQNVQPVQ